MMPIKLNIKDCENQWKSKQMLLTKLIFAESKFFGFYDKYDMGKFAGNIHIICSFSGSIGNRYLHVFYSSRDFFPAKT
jgi:hypothetical protein